jgi:hypothetical protein
VEDSSNTKRKKDLLARMRDASFPPAAVAGAFASFAAAARDFQSKSEANAASNPALVQISLSEPKSTPKVPVRFELEYKHSLTLGSSAFRRSLAGIAISPDDRIFALGDGEVRIFEPDGAATGKWKVPEQSSSLTVGKDGRIYVGIAGRIEIYDSSGKWKEGFETGDGGRPTSITAIKIANKEILVADAAARCIRRYGFDGKRLGEIGNQGKTRGFMLPNRYLDIDVNSKGVIIATDPGRHRVTSWSSEGTPMGHFGKFGAVNPEDFVGCCNPVNVAFLPDGRIVTAEKVMARIKVYNPEGKLLALIGPEHFDPKCTHLPLAVDSKGRILVADPVCLEIKLFSTIRKTGGGESI